MLCRHRLSKLIVEPVRTSSNVEIRRGGVLSRPNRAQGNAHKCLIKNRLNSNFVFNPILAEEICRNSTEKLQKFSRELEHATEKRLEYTKKQQVSMLKVFSLLRKALENNDRKLFPIGSVATGLGDSGSDIDLVLIPSCSEKKREDFQSKFGTNHFFRESYMKAVHKTLSKVVKPLNVQILHNAAVPILKLSIDDVSVDIQFNNVNPIRSSLYIRSCVECDSKVVVLIDWLKHNFKKYNLRDKNLFSAYHIYMLVFHFLNNIDNKIIPCTSAHIQLSPTYSWVSAGQMLVSGEKVVLNENPAKIILSTGELVAYLIEYYAQIDLSETALHIDGQVFQKDGDVYNNTSYMEIVDPYFSTGIRCSTLNAPSILKEHFAFLHEQLKVGRFRSL